MVTLTDEEIEQLKIKVRSPLGFDVRDRRYMLRTYRRCFIGYEAVDWICSNLSLSTREEAVSLGQRFLNEKVFYVCCQNFQQQQSIEPKLDSSNNSLKQSTGLSPPLSSSLSPDAASEQQNSNNSNQNMVIGGEFRDDYIFYTFNSNSISSGNSNPIITTSSPSSTKAKIVSNSPTLGVNQPSNIKHQSKKDFSLMKDELFQLGLDLMHSEKGIKLQKKKKSFLASPTNCFSGSQLIDWLVNQLDLSRKESLVIADKLVQLNIFFEIGAVNNQSSSIIMDTNNNNNLNNTNNNNEQPQQLSSSLGGSLSSSIITNPSITNTVVSSSLKLSSSSAFTNPAFSSSTSNITSHSSNKPVEDSTEVYYEFLTKPEAIITHIAMKRLSELHLAHKSLSTVPITIINTLNYLKVLDLSFNNLQDHNSLESVSTLYGLESLNISHNSLTMLPSSMMRLDRLQKLNVSNNNFVNIPLCVFQMIALEKLNMACNALTTLPESVQQLCKTLVHLDLRNNKLTKLPKELGLLSRLQTLDVSGYNRIQELPPFLATLPLLESLEFPDSVKTPPRSVTSKGFAHIMGYLRDMVDGTVQLSYVKLIVVGPEKTGKTQLIRALTKSANKTIKIAPSTSSGNRRLSGSMGPNSSTIINPHQDTLHLGESVETTEWKVELPVAAAPVTPAQPASSGMPPPVDISPKVSRSKPAKKAVKLIAVDFKFGNSAIYSGTHQFFLSERAFYLITCDISKDLVATQLDFWVNSVKQKAPNAPIYIVATHIDHFAGDIMKALHAITTFLNERMLEVTGVIGVSTTTARNIDLLKQEIVTTLTQHAHWFDEHTPGVYVQLEQLLYEESRKRMPPVMHWDEYVNIAKMANIASHEKLMRATHTLHRWGSIIWFDEEKHGLKDVVILSPQWLSDCFGALVMSKNTHIQSDSILSLKKLRHIWKAPIIPEALHVKLIKMLERFNLLFTLKNNVQSTSASDLSLPLSESNRSISSPLPTLSPEPAVPSFISTSSTSSFMTSIVTPSTSPSLLRNSMKLLKPVTMIPNSGMSSSLSTPTLAQQENVTQFVQGTKIIMPYLLPVDKPSHLASMWDTWQGEDMHQIGRYYTFLNAPRSCFDRLMVRFLYTMEAIVYWSSGILFRKPQNMRDSVKNNSMSSCGTLVEFDHRAQQIQLRVRGHDYDSCAKLFQIVHENVDTLLKDLAIVPSCTHVTCSCTFECRKQTTLYPIDVVETAFDQGEAYLTCPRSSKLISIEKLSPDITLASVPSTIKIAPEELSQHVEIGAGASAKVFHAILRGSQPVAVKQLNLERMDLAEGSTLIIGSSGGGGAGSSSTNTPNSSGHHFTRAPSSSSLSSNSSNDEANQLQSKLLAINEFRREVWLMSDLTHANIVHMKGFCLDPYAIVMEYMDLGSLSTYLRNKKEAGDSLAWPIIIKIAKDIAHGMAFLHNISPPLVHRDLKSPNILLATQPTEPYIIAKVSDFGLSRTVVQSFVSKVVDNPTWLAPEVLKGYEYNEKGDIYSYGMIIWELYHMTLPFEEYGIKFMSTLEDNILSGLRPTINPQCNNMYASLITKCWNADPQARPSFTAIIKVLDDIKISN